MACSSASTATTSEEEKREQTLIDAMFLCDEWKSSKGGLSTFNRELAINLAETTTGSLNIHCYVSRSDDQDREDAERHGVNLITAQTVPGSRDALKSYMFIKTFNVFMFGRATFEDLTLKGYDIVANAIGSLGGKFELTFVGSSPSEHRNVERWFLQNTSIKRKQITIRGYCTDQDELKGMFHQSDLVALPSRTEGFGLVGLEAISYGVPILVSGESGVAEALQNVEGGNTVIVGSDEDEWAQRISEVSSQSPEERQANARQLRENYRKVYSWKAECERFNRLIENVVKTANGGEMNIKVDVNYLKPEEQNMQTGILATESVRCQEVQQPRASATSAASGSVSCPLTEDLYTLRVKTFLSIIKDSFHTMKPQSIEECNQFKEYMEEMKLIITGTLPTTGDGKELVEKRQGRKGTSPLTVVPTTSHGKELMEEGQGTKGEQEGMLLLHGSTTSDLEEKLEELRTNLKKQVTCSICLDTYIEPKIISCHHTFCCECLERHAIVSQRQGKFRCPECQVEINLPEGNRFDCLPNSFWHKSLLSVLQAESREGTSPSNVPFTAGHKRKWEVRHSTGKFQEKEGSSSPPLLSTTDLEEKIGKVCEEIKMLRMEGSSPPPVSTVEVELEELLEKLQKGSMEGALSSEFHSTSSTSPQKKEQREKIELETKIVWTAKLEGTSPLTVVPTTGYGKELEEPWGRKGMLPLPGSSIFGPEEELVEPPMKLQRIKGASSSEFHSISSTSESPQNQEELKKWKQKTKKKRKEKRKEKLKGTSPPSYMFITGREKEQEELPKAMRHQERKVTSSPSDMFTTGYEREQKELPKAMRLQERKEFSTRNNKISVSKSEITEEGGALMVQNVPSRVLIPPKALPTFTEVTCSLWNQQILSPPLGRNEALVSSVMELACGNLPGTEERYEFNVKVKVALSHSASDIKGYELVIKELTNEKTNDWRDLKTRWAWTPSDIKDEHSGLDEFPDWLFPFAEAEITSFSSFAVVWRLKSFTFKNPSTLSSSFPCILSDHPGVSVTFPESSLPTGQTFALTVQVQEVPCSNAKLKEPLVVGPILHISTSEPVQLLAPARLTIPVTLREDIPKCLDYSATDVRMFCRTSEEDEREWNEVTEQLENIAVLENGTVTFTVNHFSEYWVWIDRLKSPFVTLKNVAYDFHRRLMLQEIGFFARLYATENPTIYVLTLCCFPLHLREQVQTPLSSDRRRVCAQGEGNSLKPLCKEDWMSVSLSEAFTLMQEVNLDNFLKFLGTDPFVRSLRVSISDLSNLEVELYMEKQSHRDKLCTLNFTPTLPDQTSSPRNLPSTAQVVMPEQEEDQVALEFSTAFPSPKALEETDSSISSEKVLNVTILADEWKSLKGGLSTFNRELAIHLASCSDTKLTVFVPHGACGEEEKAKAEKEEVSIIEAEELIASSPHEELFFPPENLKIDVIIGHGVKLGRQAQNIRRSKKCMWVQVVHTAPAQLGMHKLCSNAVTQSGVKNKREVDLCKIADLIMAVGPKLKGFYSDHLHHEKKQDVVEFTPGIMRELNGVELLPNENHKFQVLMFGRGDDEDFELKGYDIAAKAFASHKLKNDSYHLTFVGAAPGKEDEFAAKILEYGMSKNQLSIEEYIKDRNRLKELLLRMDLVIMPSRTEGFGLTALEALSAGLPVLAGRNSGFSEALKKVDFGELCVVKSDKPEHWSKAIKNVRQKERKKRLDEMQRLRESYGQKYNWKKQCETLVEEMRTKVFGPKNIDNKPTKTP